MSKRSVVTILIVLLLGISIWSYCKRIQEPTAVEVLSGKINGEQLPTLEGKEQLTAYFKAILNEEKRNRSWFSGTMKESKSENSSMDTSSSSAKESSSVSETNVQVKGIDEADIIKTDGKYIYQVADQRINIIQVNDDGSMGLMSNIEYDVSSYRPLQLFLQGSNLLVIGYSYEKGNEKDHAELQKGKMMYPTMSEKTAAFVYNMKNKQNPQLEREITLDGSFTSARKVGEKVYLVSNYSPHYWMMEDYPDIDLRPRVADSVTSDKQSPIPYEEIEYFPQSKEANYTTITAFDMTRPEVAAQTTTYLGSGNQLYMSPENLYLAVEKWGEEDWTNPEISAPNTSLYKFAINGLDVTFQSSTQVAGTILNQFSMDEYNGYFRVATTEGFAWDESSPSNNQLLVFDQNLKEVGKLTNLARGERIYSARFMGDRVYIVTFKETDPLFVIDTSVANAPKLLGELKIPGFSNYLHPLDENHLIGFGYDTKIVTFEGQKEPSIVTEGVKLSLFDITDVTNPKEKFTEIIGERGTHSPLNYDHKALLFNKKTGLFAFPINVYTNVKGSEFEQQLQFQGAYVYNVTANRGFELKDKITHMQGELFYEEWENEIHRLVYIGEYLYALSPSKISSTNLSTFEKMSELRLN